MEPVAVAPAYVDVVAGVEHEVERLGGEMAEGGEVAGLEVAASADREAQPIDRRSRGWRRPGPADTARVAAGVEPVEVLSSCFEPGRLDVHAVPEFGPGGCRSAARDSREAVVVGDLPPDGDVHHVAHPRARRR